VAAAAESTDQPEDREPTTEALEVQVVRRVVSTASRELHWACRVVWTLARVLHEVALVVETGVRAAPNKTSHVVARAEETAARVSQEGWRVDCTAARVSQVVAQPVETGVVVAVAMVRRATAITMPVWLDAPVIVKEAVSPPVAVPETFVHAAQA
jgi:hypothetical protein